MQHLEEQIAHLTHTVDELNGVVTRQQEEIDRLSRRVEMLLQREADRSQEATGGIVIGDERPPHY
ncbi:MAG: SlyX family protein [Ruegeria sp.]